MAQKLTNLTSDIVTLSYHCKTTSIIVIYRWPHTIELSLRGGSSYGCTGAVPGSFGCPIRIHQLFPTEFM